MQAAFEFFDHFNHKNVGMTEEEFEIKLHDEAKKKNIILNLDGDIVMRSKTLDASSDMLKSLREFQIQSKSTAVITKM